MAGSHRCLGCLKYLMFIFNLVFWLGGCGLFGVGVWLAVTQAPFATLSSSFPSVSAANLILVAGGVTMVIGFIGCLGAVKEHRCLLMSLGGCGLFGVGVWLAVTQAPFATLSSSFPSVSAANLILVAGGITMVIGFIGCLGAVKEHRCLLMSFKCCGVSNSSDWNEIPGISELPRSCCSGTGQPVCKTLDTPCYKQVKDWLHEHIHSVLVFGIAIGIVQLEFHDIV
ncbi:UNVERIFIED_CONTAM: hypothetical protein FKN15_020614 [Acipenser sinensis]